MIYDISLQSYILFYDIHMPICPVQQGNETSSPARKRGHVDISASQKRDVCLYKEQHPKATQAKILVHFSNEWGVSVGRSTISDILRDKVKWLSVSKECGPRE